MIGWQRKTNCARANDPRITEIRRKMSIKSTRGGNTLSTKKPMSLRILSKRYKMKITPSPSRIQSSSSKQLGSRGKSTKATQKYSNSSSTASGKKINDCAKKPPKHIIYVKRRLPSYGKRQKEILRRSSNVKR